MELAVAHYWPYLVILIFFGLTALCVRAAATAWNDAVKLDAEEHTFMERLAAPLTSRLAPRNEIQVRQLRLQLMRAGFRDEAAMNRFTMFRALLLVTSVSTVVALKIIGVAPLRLAVAGVVLLYVAVRAPDFYLHIRSKIRRERISRALPALIDLMVLCLDVGLSVEASFERVTSEMQSLEPLMAEEANVMVGEMGAGLNFPTALKRMADRVGIDELSTMSRLINQASTLGASVTNALREYSESALTKRILALDEYAGKISTWLVMPLVLCMLPASLLVLVAPSIVNVVHMMRHG